MDEITSINYLGIIFTVSMCILTLTIPRKYAHLPMIIIASYMTLGHQTLLLGLHFSMLRFVIMFGWIRLFIRGELTTFKLNAIDKAIICWVIVNAFIYIANRQNVEAFINRGGMAYDALGLYFFFRIILKDYQHIQLAIVSLAIIIIPLAFIMLNERMTGYNLFSIFGGVSDITPERDGKLRCRGPFLSAITAGSVGATLMPLFLPMCFRKGNLQIVGLLGIASATVITILSTSSGPVVAYLGGVVALLFWPLRRHMKMMRWVLVAALVSLHFVMKAPVWHIMARTADLIGGHGWYRAAVIDKAIEHLDEWWLIGTEYTLHWDLTPLWNQPGRTDITNQFVHQGVYGGLITMLLFILIIVLCYRSLGNILKKWEHERMSKNIIVWSLGSALFAHIVNFYGVSYFDQIIVFWYLLLAMISVLTSFCLSNKEKQKNVILFQR